MRNPSRSSCYPVAMKNIQVPIQMNHPEAERRTVLFGSQMALETNMGVVLTYYLDVNGSSNAVTRSLESASAGYDPTELTRQREEFILNTLVEYQGLVLRTLYPSPPVSYMVISDTKADRKFLESGMEGIGLFLLCGDNLETHSFTWIHEINSLILNNGRIPILIHNPGREFLRLNRVVFGISSGRLEEKDFRKLTGLFDPDRTEIIALFITGEVDTDRLNRLTSQLEKIKSETGYRNMKMDTLVTREKLNAFNLSNSFAIDREADLIVCPGCNFKDGDDQLHPEEVRRNAAKTEIPFMIY